MYIIYFYIELDHKIWLILVFTWIIIASTYLAIKISIDTIPPLLMSGIRYTISGIMLFFIFKIYSLEIFDKKRKQTEKKQKEDRFKKYLNFFQQKLHLIYHDSYTEFNNT